MTKQTSKTTGTVVDLDEQRAARREALGKDVKIKFGGKTFPLPPEIPLAVTDALTEIQIAQGGATKGEDLTPEQTQALMGALRSFGQALLGPDQWATFLEARPSFQDLEALLDESLKEYGMTEGESGASATS